MSVSHMSFSYKSFSPECERFTHVLMKVVSSVDPGTF